MLLACGGTVNTPIAQQKEVDHMPAEMSVKPEPPQNPRQPIKRNADEKLVGGPGKPEVPQDPMWASPTKVVLLGDLQVQIIKISICKVPLKDLIRKEAVSADELLMVKLDLLNTNPTKKINYQTWSGKSISFERDYATLKDNFENIYKRIGFGFSSQPVGSVERSDSIYPNKSISEVLVFEVPLETATHLDLELPAKNYGCEGNIRFRIPTKTIISDSKEQQMLLDQEAKLNAKKLADVEEEARAENMAATKRRSLQIEAQKKAAAQERIDNANAEANKMLSELIKTRAIYRQAKEDSPNWALAKPALVRVRKSLNKSMTDGLIDLHLKEKIASALKEKD